MKLEDVIVLPQTIKVKWNGRNSTHYRSKGYEFTRMGDEFNVSALDIKPGSDIKVKCICKYCKSETLKSFGAILDTVDSICCNTSDCRQKKAKEVNLNRYGVESFTQSDIFKEKSKETNIERYGVEFASQSPVIRSKVKKTTLDRYGVEHISQVPEIKQKQVYSWVKSIYENGSGPSSQQQRYIHSIIGGELNYPVESFLLDIAFPSDSVYVEYDGGGHDLNVKLGKITKEDFELAQIKRYNILKSLNWKLIRIKSVNDNLLDDKLTIYLINEAKLNILNGRSWFEIDIDEMKIRCSKFTQDIKRP
jgi:hypothetical protein